MALEDDGGETTDGNGESPAPLSRWETIVRRERCSFSPRPTYTSPSGCISISFTTPDAHRMQIQAKSCDIWFPKTHVPGLEPAFEFMMRMRPQCPALAAALDASSLCHLGQSSSDVRLLRAGQAYHGKALSLLRRELASTTDRRNEGLVGAITVLQITEAFTAMDFGDSWLQHAKGLTALMQSCQYEDTIPGFQQMLEASFQLFHIWAGLIRRESISCSGDSDNATVLVRIAEQVPGALELAAKICKCRAMVQMGEVSQVIAMLRKIEEQLHAWAVMWNRCMRSAPYQLIDSAKATMLDFAIAEGNKKPFPLYMEFNSVYDGLDHCICTAALLSVKRAMLDIDLAFRLRGFVAGLRQQVDDLTSAATNCADNLCMSIPFLLKPEHGVYGYVVAGGPLRLATEWYQALQAGSARLKGNKAVTEKLRWCRQVSAQIRKHGIRPL